MKISKDIHYLSVEERKQDWINKCRAKFGDRFDYSEVNYVNSITKVKIYCKECKIWFEQTPRGHLKSPYGCAGCYNRAHSHCIGFNTKQLIECIKSKYGENKFDFSKTKFKKFNKEITLIDLESGEELKITPEELLRTGNLIPTRSSGESLVYICLEKIQKDENIKFDIIPEYNIVDLIQGRHTKLVKIDYRIVTEDGREYWTEYNGGYHYKPATSRSNWEEQFMCQLERDINVKQYCDNSNGKITLIELPYMYYNDLDSIEGVLKKILLEGNKPEDIIKQPIINFVDVGRGDKTKIETINKLISIRNNTLNKEEWNNVLSSVNTILGQERAYTNTTIARILFQYFHVGDLILHRDIREKLREIYTSINYSKIPKATNLREFFEIRRNSMTFKDGSKPAAFRIMSVKPEYQEIYDSINPKEEKGSE